MIIGWNQKNSNKDEIDPFVNHPVHESVSPMTPRLFLAATI